MNTDIYQLELRQLLMFAFLTSQMQGQKPNLRYNIILYKPSPWPKVDPQIPKEWMND